MIKLLLGGSPCTFWSVAQKNGRETEAKGLGWELFKNYFYAKKKFKPDYFLYENNKSVAQPIKNQISRKLDAPLMDIDSALVSAQLRERFYCFNWTVDYPEDRGIILRDILESGTSDKEKAYCLTATYEKAVPTDMLKRGGRTMIFEPIRIGDIGSTAQAHRVYSCEGKARTLIANAGGQGGKTGLYLCPTDRYDKRIPLYEVKNGFITCQKQAYPINLPEGYYIIRKLTPIEAERLQTLPDNYTAAVSAAQRYKTLGNGWCAEVIIHILKGALQGVSKDEELIVLSMYDGIATGRYCLDKMGFTNVRYFAYETDKYAMQVAMSNYPDIIQCGDAFNLRNPDWTIGY